ncbi:potassium-transporting ATPase subunit C, partial [bacterium]
HISVENARLQAPRVARARGLDLETVRRLVAERTEGRDLGVLADEAVLFQKGGDGRHDLAALAPRRWGRRLFRLRWAFGQAFEQIAESHKTSKPLKG